ncbi:MAG: GlsB/YeaQ/YmgE family stress response membrane protein [Planctomycetota bacterium]|nr:MAG: GlsB/YeaQ/YmgE family stress response membrane protein [Planctomycetota bacterium]
MGIGSLIGWAVFGLIVGALAKLIWPGRQPGGCLTTILLGVAGSLVGGMITYALTGGPEREFHPARWVMSIIGAIVVLWIYGATTSRPKE